MSAPSKKHRSAAAFMAGMENTEARSREAEAESPDRNSPPEVVGAWSIHGRKGLRERFEEVEQEAKRANEIQYQGILEGKIPIQIPPEKIHDIVGTDRIVDRPDGDDADSFASLVRNIQNRGQRVPIRVRPINSDWRPNPATPRDITGQEFALQSGRRRLAACAELGIEVLCFLSFAEEDKARLEDLQERFYENAVRRDLNQIERLFSIGLIATETPEASQAQIAEIMGVSRPIVNRAVGVVEHFDELREILDLATATRDDIDRALKMVRSKSRSEHPEALKTRKRRERSLDELPPLPFRKRETGNGTLSLSRSRTGSTVLKIEAPSLSEERIAEILRIMENG